MKKILFFTIALLAITSCDEETKFITFEKEEYTIHFNDTLQLTLQASDINSTSYAYFVDNPHIVSISENGVVSGISIGTTRIIATNSHMQTQCYVIVEPYENLFAIPDSVIVGKSLPEMKLFENRILVSETESSLTYLPANSDTGLDSLKYSFNNNLLSGITAFLRDYEFCPLEQTYIFLRERYSLTERTNTFNDYRTRASIFYNEESNEIVYTW